MLLVSSYPPRKCGIASFCYDMAGTIRRIFGQSLPVEICALQNNAQSMPYGEEVSYVLNTSESNQYLQIADELNDGLEQMHVNIHQGAESSLYYFLARLVVEKYASVKSASESRYNTFRLLCSCEQPDCHPLTIERHTKLKVNQTLAV